MTRRRTTNFQPNAPSKPLWIAAIIIGGLGILGRFINMGDLSVFSYWLLLIGFFLLVAGTSYKKM